MHTIRNPYNDEVLILNDPQNACRKHITWEIESACSLKCKYCYPSRIKNSNLSRERVMQLVHDINAATIEHVHLTGGEPTQSPHLEYILDALHNKQVYITTNLASRVELVESLILRYRVYSVAVSLDSTRANINDSLRGQTSQVINHIERLVSFKESHRLATKIRIHCVISKANLPYIPELLLWAKTLGIDEVSCQPISIDKCHECYDDLHLEYGDMERIQSVLQTENRYFHSNYADPHSKLIRYCLRNRDCSILGPHDLCSLFIDANGNVWNCPRRRIALPDIFSTAEATDCPITPQCMTCLKHLEVSE